MNQKQKVFITGGSGFVGRHIIDALLKNNFEIFVLTRNKTNIGPEFGLADENILVGDINSISNFSEKLSSCNYFIHNAGEKSDPAKMKQVNISGINSVLSEIKKHLHIKLIHISSAGVYGIEKHSQNVIDEVSICLPDNEYEKTKLESEKIVADFGRNHHLKYCILRPSNVFGENDEGYKLLNLFKALKRNHFFCINPNAVANYVYIKQITNIIGQLIKEDIFQNKIYNINAACKIFDFIKMIKESLGIKNKTRRIPSSISPSIKILGKMCDLLPDKYQFINSGKYRELTSVKYYSTVEINNEIIIDERKFLEKGIYNLVNYYKQKGLL